MTASRFTRRHLLGAALAGATVGLAAPAAPVWADSRTVKLLVGFPPGGGTDAIARLLAEPLREALGVPVVVENRAGAGGQIAAQALKAAAPDGSTLFLTHDHTISILPQVLRNPGFDPAKDFVAVAGFATCVNALAVSGATPARSYRDFIAWVRQQGGRANVGIPAPASVPQFLVQSLARREQLDLVAVPYRGSAPMMADMLGNQIPAGVGSIPDFIENHKAGKLHVVAVMGRARQALLPEVPTLAELGITGFEEVPYYGLFAPAGTPRAALEPISAALAKALAQPTVRDRLTAMGLAVGFMSGEQLAQRERAYTEVWARIIRDSGFQPQ
ncbi:Bug family tripartite tricarboxylate transporter substrate binding protein [uncultured Tepidimonas sp.]|uniref:Bug family tripartite tricarboxylate transporter substrate binding protein n=1 Tax=uncultured Tepidimonas sp. TaxID=453579 RepID=UPI002604862E|nr:Bug family tripartite tricarboxylate transporter substrate binding protein [uncultured Tepidimonas sp.]